MWVFDGEEWTQDNGNEHSSPRTETPRPRYDERMPELQVVEIVQIPKVRERPIVVPLPTP
jgi:hypothetical protein